MGYNNDASNSDVLELAEGSRTESLRAAEERAATKLLAAEPADKPDGIRPMEAVWALAAFVLFSAYIQKSDVSHQVVQERQQVLERGCISQYAAGERYARPKPLNCAPMVEAPNYIMTSPIQ